MIINPYLFAAAPAYVYTVDDYSPLHAYSLRKLSTGSTNAIRVRRTSDNAEQDIGFTGNDLDSASLDTFCSGTDGYVAKWYDQASTNDLLQATSSLQPQICSSGTTLTDPNNGKAAVLFNGSTQLFTLTSGILTTATWTEVGMFNRASSGIYSVMWGTTGGTPHLFEWRGSDDISYWKPSNGTEATIEGANTSTGNFIVFTTGVSGNVYHWKNDSAKSTPAFTWSSSARQLLRAFGTSGNEHNGYAQETFLWNSDEQSNRTGIQDSINNYYSVY